MEKDLRAGEALAAVRRLRAERDAAERGILEQAIIWASLHEATPDEVCATWDDAPLAITGEGAPLLLESCISEFAAVMGMRTGAGRQYLADAIELAHRLPDVLEQVRRGRVPVFKARRIAGLTADLAPEGAARVDRHVAFSAGRVSLAQVERLVEEARAKFQPEEAAWLAEKAAEIRKVVVNTRQVSSWGTMSVYAELDLADAMDLDQAVQLLAKQIEADHPELTPGACRAKALGALARGELILPADPGDPTAADVIVAGPQHRVMHLNVHLTSDGVFLDQTVFLEKGKRLLVLDQIRTWCSDATRVVVRPVIDLHERLSITGYAIPERVQERVKLRDRKCVFPFCEHQATHCDTDHVTPYDENGPPDQTSTDNLASLCRHHHRLKTHHRWRYVMVEPGVCIWTSPRGYRYLVDGTGTRELTPATVAAPRAA